jgi:hypothetical protein
LFLYQYKPKDIKIMSHKISSTALASVINSEKNNSGADFTLKSLATGKDFTYKIARKEFKGNWYTHISVEVGYLDFQYLGTYFSGAIRRKGAPITTSSAQAIAYVLLAVEGQKFAFLDEKMDLMHKGSCLVCGRTLTDANSIESGLGPVCRNR